MNSKEALEIIIFRLTSHEEDLELRETDKKAIEIIKQNLERLEKLEIENRNNEKVIKDSVKLINKNLELRQENEKLKKAIEKELALLNERRETFWVTDSYDEYAVVNAIIEELKEVLE